MGASLVSNAVAAAVQTKGPPRRGSHLLRPPVGSRVATVILNYMDQNDLVRNSKRQGERLLQGLNEIKAGHASSATFAASGSCAVLSSLKTRPPASRFRPS